MSPELDDKVSLELDKSELNKEDIVDLLNKEDVEDEPKLEEPKKETKKEDDEKEEEEIELKDEEPDLEELELVTPVRRQQILKKYPALFKEFPYLEKAYYRDQKFTDLFATPEDAEEIVSKSKQLDQFESDLVDGNTLPVLQAVKKANPDAFNKLVDNYLGNLMQVDQNAYYHVAGNIIKSTIASMAKEAKASENKTLNAAAAVLNQFVFGTSEYTPPHDLYTKTDNKESDGESKLKAEREAFIKEKFDTVREDLNSKIENTIKSTISQHIDPKESMSQYVKRTATSDAFAKLESMIGDDPSFTKILDRLWEKAFADNFSKQSVDRIRSTYLAKAKTLLPDVIRSVRKEALGSTSHKSSNEDKRGPIPAGKPSPQSKGGRIKEAKEIPMGMSTLDFLNAED